MSLLGVMALTGICQSNMAPPRCTCLSGNPRKALVRLGTLGPCFGNALGVVGNKKKNGRKHLHGS